VGVIEAHAILGIVKAPPPVSTTEDAQADHTRTTIVDPSYILCIQIIIIEYSRINCECMVRFQ